MARGIPTARIGDAWVTGRRRRRRGARSRPWSDAGRVARPLLRRNSGTGLQQELRGSVTRPPEGRHDFPDHVGFAVSPLAHTCRSASWSSSWHGCVRTGMKVLDVGHANAWSATEPLPGPSGAAPSDGNRHRPAGIRYLRLLTSRSVQASIAAPFAQDVRSDLVISSWIT